MVFSLYIISFQYTLLKYSSTILFINSLSSIVIQLLYFIILLGIYLPALPLNPPRRAVRDACFFSPGTPQWHRDIKNWYSEQSGNNDFYGPGPWKSLLPDGWRSPAERYRSAMPTIGYIRSLKKERDLNCKIRASVAMRTVQPKARRRYQSEFIRACKVVLVTGLSGFCNSNGYGIGLSL